VRGLAIVVMVTNHLAARSYLNSVLQGRIYATAAEAFVLLSGVVLGMISQGRLVNGTLPDASKKLVDRALTLYKAYVVVVGVAAVATLVRPGVAAPLFDALHGSWAGVAVALPTLRLAPHLLDVLELYVVCLVASPALLYALQRKWTVAVVVGSVALWLLHQLHPYALTLPPLEREHPYFAVPAWQLLYVGGFVIGFHRAAVAKAWSKVPRPIILAVALPLVALAIVANHYDTQLGVWPTAVSARASWIAAVDRSSLGPLRVVTVAALFSCIWLAVDACWRPLERSVGGVFVLLGQSSLYLYLVHVPIVIAWHAVGLPGASAAVTTLGQVGVIVALWVMVRTKFLFGVVPR
jgi:hypothetical protein